MNFSLIIENSHIYSYANNWQRVRTEGREREREVVARVIREKFTANRENSSE